MSDSFCFNSEEKENYFKIIIFNTLTEKDRSIIKRLEKDFSKDDIKFEVESDRLICYVRQLDVEQFKFMINDYLDNQETSKSMKSRNDSVLLELVEKIENIKSYGIKSGKRLFHGYADERKVKNRKKIEKRRGDIYYAKYNYSKENTNVPLQYLNGIICEDSEIFLKKLPSNCIDLIFTSPPYNFGIEYDEYVDGTNWNSYFNKLFTIFKECIRVLKYGGRIIVNVQPLFSDYIPSHHIISQFFMEQGLIWKGEILWEKNNYNCKYTAWGSWKSPSSPYLKYTWEFLEIFCKGSLKKEGEKENIDISADEFKKWVVAKWDIAPERNMKKYEHDAMFPEKLVERVVKLFSFKNDVVLDPFNGVGSTTAIAKKFNRNYIGIDTSKKYCDTARQRLSRIKPDLKSK